MQHVIIGLDTSEMLSDMELSGPATIDFGIEEIEEEDSDFDEDEEGENDENDEFDGVGPLVHICFEFSVNGLFPMGN